MKNILIFITILAIIPVSVAQKWGLEYGIAGTYPINKFKDEGYKSGIGHSLTILSAPFPKYYNWQLQMGVNVNHFWANRVKGEIYYYDDSVYPYRANYKVQNRHSAISFKTRLSSKPNPVRLYADLDLGYRLYKTKEKIIIDDYNKEAKYFATLKSNGNFFAGITGGILFRMNRYWYLTLYSRLDYGLNSTWLELNSVSFASISGYIQPNYSNYEYKRTHSTLLWSGFSMTFYFGGDGSAKKPKSYSNTTPNFTPIPQSKPNSTWDESKPEIELPQIIIPTIPKSTPPIVKPPVVNPPVPRTNPRPPKPGPR